MGQEIREVVKMSRRTRISGSTRRLLDKIVSGRSPVKSRKRLLKERMQREAGHER